MRTHISFLLSLLLSLLAFTSCEEDLDNPSAGPVDIDPINTSHGSPIGEKITASIGPEGGTLAMPDGTIALSIPAGAVAEATEFSIQQVENTFPDQLAPSFRLLPEGVAFSKPVTLTFSYEGADLTGTDEEFLFLTYQDAEGDYRVARNTLLHKDSKTLTVETRHFSDWTFFATFLLVADDYAVNKNGTTTLKVKDYIQLCLCTDEDPRFGELMDYSNATTKMEWSINYGEGKVEATTQGQATFTAPEFAPTVNPVGVGVRMSNFKSIYNPNDPERLKVGKEVLYLNVDIQVMDEEFVEYTFMGKTFYNNNDFVIGSMRMDTRDGFYLRSYISGNKTMELIISDPENTDLGKGNYTFGDTEKGIFASIEVVTGWEDDNNTYKTSYYVPDDWGSPTIIKYAEGEVKITKWGAIGDFVEGEVTTKLYRAGETKPSAKDFTMKFKAKRVQ